ncbi:hypothetical protein X975_00326, partial [Stegodyphus mimosarum]
VNRQFAYKSIKHTLKDENLVNSVTYIYIHHNMLNKKKITYILVWHNNYTL